MMASPPPESIKPSVLASAPPEASVHSDVCGKQADPALFPAIYPEEIIVQANVAENGDEPSWWTTSPCPSRTLNSYMRIGGFDFVDDDTAAVCTWNGDVWLVEGLREMGEIWRICLRLFETLGLAVRDGQILSTAKTKSPA